VWGTTSQRAFQLWIGLNGSEDISFAYDPANLPADPNGQTLVVGVENSDGSGGEQIDGPPTGDLRVTGGTPTPGDTATYSFTVQGATVGQGRVTSTLDSKSIPGTTVETETIKVVRRAG
jgi:hypothetical protein